MYNFLLMGAQGVGKTTLLNNLSNSRILKMGINPIKGVTREYIRRHNLTSGYDTTYTDMFAYYTLFLSAFNKSQNFRCINVFDRFILDPLIYARLKFELTDYICVLGEELFKVLR